jgi:NADH-quinone oxidoreductase subunit C
MKALFPEALAQEIPGMEAYAAQPGRPAIYLRPEALPEAGRFLRDDPRCYFDLLECISGIDYGPGENRMELAYHLSSVLHEYAITLICKISREEGASVPSVADIWRAADWHEREAWDLLGIRFTGRPSLDRILLPADWKGHPLRKDYEEQETYRGIRVKE